MFVEVLTAAGYAPVPAYSVTDALAALAYQHFDAAILDVELRDGAIFPVADQLAAQGTPYLFASAIYSQAIPKEHQDVPFVGKPFNIDDLLLRVEQIISGVDLASPAG
nr:response regulator [Stenotrophomonas bentonitica]